jgi:hypothetical protein
MKNTRVSSCHNTGNTRIVHIQYWMYQYRAFTILEYQNRWSMHNTGSSSILNGLIMSVPGDDYSWKAYQRFNSFILMIRHFHSQQKRMSQEKNHHTQVSIWVTFSLTVQEDHTWCWALWEHKHRWWKMHSVRSSLYENIVNVLSFSSILIIFYVYSTLLKEESTVDKR